MTIVKQPVLAPSIAKLDYVFGKSLETTPKMMANAAHPKRARSARFIVK